MTGHSEPVDLWNRLALLELHGCKSSLCPHLGYTTGKLLPPNRKNRQVTKRQMPGLNSRWFVDPTHQSHIQVWLWRHTTSVKKRRRQPQKPMGDMMRNSMSFRMREMREIMISKESPFPPFELFVVSLHLKTYPHAQAL